MEGFAVHFAEVSDPRADNARHDFLTAMPLHLFNAASDIDFPGIAAVAKVETRRRLAGEPETVIVRGFLLSCLLTPQRRIEVARTHWTIENQLHWVLDVDFAEDVARSRKDNAPRTSP